MITPKEKHMKNEMSRVLKGCVGDRERENEREKALII